LTCITVVVNECEIGLKRLKELELENSRLRKAVSDLTLDKLILQEAARGNF
jgi:putative transposase